MKRKTHYMTLGVSNTESPTESGRRTTLSILGSPERLHSLGIHNLRLRLHVFLEARGGRPDEEARVT